MKRSFLQTNVKAQPAPLTESDTTRPAASAAAKKPPKFSFLPLNGAVGCKPCNPSDGLAIGNRPITIEELQSLSPDELAEHPISRHGKELSMEEFAELLEMPAEFAEMVQGIEYDDDNDPAAFMSPDEMDFLMSLSLQDMQSMQHNIQSLNNGNTK